MKCGIMRPDLTVCAEEFAETGLITPERMRAIDANTQALGVSGLQLMESAGRALAGAVLAYSPKNVLVLCGRGNNGGDGMAAARYLQRGIDTTVCYLDHGNRSPSCARQFEASGEPGLCFARLCRPMTCAALPPSLPKRM